MDAGFFEPIIIELDKVENRLRKDYKLRSGNVTMYAHMEFSLLERYLRPALVILFSQIGRHQGDKAVYLASIIQLIFMSGHIHLCVPDEDRQGDLDMMDPRDGSQLPVLVGDYLYGKFYTTLYEADLLHLLKPLSEIICSMNEGSILRRKTQKVGDINHDKMLEIIQKETAELFLGACKFGLQLGQPREQEISNAEQFGYFFGMAYGLLCQDNRDGAVEFQEKALQELANFEDSPARNTIMNIINKIFGRDCPNFQLAVV